MRDFGEIAEFLRVDRCGGNPERAQSCDELVMVRISAIGDAIAIALPGPRRSGRSTNWSLAQLASSVAQFHPTTPDIELDRDC